MYRFVLPYFPLKIMHNPVFQLQDRTS